MSVEADRRTVQGRGNAGVVPDVRRGAKAAKLARRGVAGNETKRNENKIKGSDKPEGKVGGKTGNAKGESRTMRAMVWRETSTGNTR